MTEHHIGIDLGGSRIKTVCVAPEGGVIAKENVGSASDNATAWIADIKEILSRWQQNFGPPNSIGLCAPGLASRDASRIDYMPGRMESLEGLDWTRALGTSIPVRVLNDAHAALLGEVWQGAARNTRNAAMFTLGTGVGGALLCDGRLLRGAIGRAGHLGHISLDPDGHPGITRCPAPLEDAIGNHNVATRSVGRYADTRHLLDAVVSGDLDAAMIWQCSVRALGAAIVSVINVADPEIIILGGGIASADDVLFKPLNAYLDAHEWRPGGHRVTLVHAALGDAAGALGAAYFGSNFGDLS